MIKTIRIITYLTGFFAAITIGAFLTLIVGGPIISGFIAQIAAGTTTFLGMWSFSWGIILSGFNEYDENERLKSGGNQK